MTNTGQIFCSFFYNSIIFMYSGFQVGETALMRASANGKCDVVTELISLGADVDIQAKVSHFLCLIMTLSVVLHH